MPANAALGNGELAIQAAVAFSDIVGVVNAKSSSDVTISGTSKPAPDLPIASPDGTAKPDPEAMYGSQSQSQSQSKAAQEKDTASGSSGQTLPLSLTQTGAPVPGPLSFLEWSDPATDGFFWILSPIWQAPGRRLLDPINLRSWVVLRQQLRRIALLPPCQVSRRAATT